MQTSSIYLPSSVDTNDDWMESTGCERVKAVNHTHLWVTGRWEECMHSWWKFRIGSCLYAGGRKFLKSVCLCMNKCMQGGRNKCFSEKKANTRRKLHKMTNLKLYMHGFEISLDPCCAIIWSLECKCLRRVDGTRTGSLVYEITVAVACHRAGIEVPVQRSADIIPNSVMHFNGTWFWNSVICCYLVAIYACNTVF